MKEKINNSTQKQRAESEVDRCFALLFDKFLTEEDLNKTKENDYDRQNNTGGI